MRPPITRPRPPNLASLRTRRPPWRMRPHTIRRTFGTAPEAVLVRSVLDRLIEEIAAGNEPRLRSNVRTLGYRYVLPVWVHAYGPDRGSDTMHDRTSDVLRDLILEFGATSYEELGITDPAWEARRIGTTRPHVIVAAEDRDLVRMLRTIHADLGVTTLATYGSASVATAEYTAAHVLDALAERPTAPPARLLSLADYDPWGWDNAIAFARNLEAYGLAPIEVTHLLRPERLPAPLVARIQIPLPPPQANQAAVQARWMKASRGIDGRPAKLEATSIPEAILIDLAARALA